MQRLTHTLSADQYCSITWANLILRLNWAATYIQRQSHKEQWEHSKPSPCPQHAGIQAGYRPSAKSLESAPSGWAHPGHKSNSSAPVLPCRHTDSIQLLSRGLGCPPLRSSASHSIPSIGHSLTEGFPECHPPYAYTSVHVLHAFCTHTIFGKRAAEGEKGVD